MAEQRLIDANSLKVLFEHEYRHNKQFKQSSAYKAWQGAIQLLYDQPTIDPETLPIVRQLREELEKVTAEREAAVGDLTFAVNKYRLFTTDINLCYLCKFDFPPTGKNEQTYECPGCYGDDCFEWRGPQKEE